MHMTIWMNLRCIMLSERSQTQKATHCMIPCARHTRKHKTRGTRNNSCQGIREESSTKGQHKGMWEVMEMFCILTCLLVVIWLHLSKLIELYNQKSEFYYQNFELTHFLKIENMSLSQNNFRTFFFPRVLPSVDF